MTVTTPVLDREMYTEAGAARYFGSHRAHCTTGSKAVSGAARPTSR